MREEFEKWCNDNPGYTYRDVWQAATALQAERVRELAKKAIPEPIKMEPFQTIDKASKNYSAGWNACRAEITAKMAIELQAEQALSATAREVGE